jgi:hypothetical protein
MLYHGLRPVSLGRWQGVSTADSTDGLQGPVDAAGGLARWMVLDGV